ncbi:MAG: ATP synthase subunit I [Gammaproteobacteria bacterium]|nr:ATP synthase subunit I [Gammaproteobacteria bacterium]
MYSKSLNRKKKILFFWWTQCFFLVLLTPFLAMVYKKMAYSFCWGGVTYLLPHGYFIHKSFQHAGALMAKRIFWDLCVGQALKWFLTGLLFLLAFKVVHPLMFPYFVGFVVMQTSTWFMACVRGRA